MNFISKKFTEKEIVELGDKYVSHKEEDYVYFISEMYALFNLSKQYCGFDVFQITVNKKTMENLEKENVLTFFEKIETEEGEIAYRRNTKSQQLIYITVKS